MRCLRLSLQIALYGLLSVFVACAPTEFSSIWKDETYQEHPKKMLVISSFSNPAIRRTFEDEFVKALKERGIDAVTSYTIMPDVVVSDKDTAALQAKDVGADAVLISSSSGSKMGETGRMYINIQTNIYSVQSNNLIFSASSRTWLEQTEPYVTQIKSYVRNLVNHLSRLGLV